MSKLQDLIQKLCSDGVEYKTIQETVGVNRGKRNRQIREAESNQLTLFDYDNN